MTRRTIDFITKHFVVLSDYAGIASTLILVAALTSTMVAASFQIAALRARHEVQRVRQADVERDIEQLNKVVFQIHQELNEIHPKNQAPRWLGPKRGNR